MEDESASFNLLLVDLGNELEVNLRLTLLLLDNARVAAPVVEPLPGAPACTHRRSDDEERLLGPQEVHGLAALGLDVKVPPLTVVGIHRGQVER